VSHFAKVINGIVTEVLVIEQDVIDTGLFGDPSPFVQTSYNTHGGQHPEGRPLRKNYAGIGYTYDVDRDAFYAPQPYPSWVLDEETCLWDAPVAYPTGDKPYIWDETALSWVEELPPAPEAPIIEPMLSTAMPTTEEPAPVEPMLSTAVSAVMGGE
jgi:hypothetical protein